jgi:integrase
MAGGEGLAYVRRRVLSGGRVRYDAWYRDAAGRRHSTGTFLKRHDAAQAARNAETKIAAGQWIDPADGRVTFAEYVAKSWWPSRHLEVSTRAAYRSYLHTHFLPYFGQIPIASILPSTVHAWVSFAHQAGLSPRSIRKYHVLLHNIFRRAVQDRVIAFNPCADTELPKVVAKPTRILSPAEFERLLDAIPQRHRVMMLVAIETGMRWGELVGLRVRHVDFLRRTVLVQDVVVEVSKKDSPTGERFVTKPYPKNDQLRRLRITSELLEAIARHVENLDLRHDDLLFPANGCSGGGPISRANFRTRIWLSALTRAGLGSDVRFHDLRHTHASWLLAGGADLKVVMDRMGHAQLATTQRYLHTLPDTDDRALDAFQRTRSS